MATELPDGYALRNATTEDLPAIHRMVAGAFGDEPAPHMAALFDPLHRPERSRVVTFDEQIVGHLESYQRSLVVPGATVAASYVSTVAVSGDHRRRGLLTALMHEHLVREPEAISVLMASQGQIYQRYGYGIGCLRGQFEVHSDAVRLRPGPDGPGLVGTVRTGEPAAVRDQLRSVYEQVHRRHPGWSSRDELWWDVVLSDPESLRKGTALRASVFHDGQTNTGYALWRTSMDWTRFGPTGSVQLRELVAATPQAYRALWHRLLGVDLTDKVVVPFAAVDEPLMYQVDEPRALGATAVDGIWVRLVDIPRALAARRYSAALDVTIEVDDPVLPGNCGRYRLTCSDDGVATCAPTAEPADLGCDVAALACAYLGGVSLHRLAQTGRVRQLRHAERPGREHAGGERPGGGPLERASRAFGWHQQPSIIEMF